MITSILVLMALIAFRQIKLKKELILGYFFISTIWTTNLLFNITRGTIAISDEFFYLEADLLHDFPARFIWLLLNHAALLDFGEPILTMKLINLFFALGFFTFLSKHLTEIKANYLAIILAYLGIIASYNFRDILIIWLTFLMLFSLENCRQSKLFFLNKSITFPTILLGLGLTLLRPLQMLTIYLSNVKIKYLVIGLAFFLVTFTFLSVYFKSTFYTFFWRIENIDLYLTNRIEKKGFDIPDTGLTPLSLFEWLMKFVLAPIPTSLLVRMFGGASVDYQFGAFDEAIRFFHRTFYYLILTFIFCCLFSKFRVFKRVVKQHSGIILFIFMYSLTYAIFNFGGSHERIKFTVYIGILVIFNSLLRGNNEKNNILYKN